MNTKERPISVYGDMDGTDDINNPLIRGIGPNNTFPFPIIPPLVSPYFYFETFLTKNTTISGFWNIFGDLKIVLFFAKNISISPKNLLFLLVFFASIFL